MAGKKREALMNSQQGGLGLANATREGLALENNS